MRKADMKKIFYIVASVLIFLPLESKELENCKWDNQSGTPCLNVFSAPNTSELTEGTLGKTVITKKQMIDSGYQDVRSVLEYVAGLDVFANHQKCINLIINTFPAVSRSPLFVSHKSSGHLMTPIAGKKAVACVLTLRGLFSTTKCGRAIYRIDNQGTYIPPAPGKVAVKDLSLIHI